MESVQTSELVPFHVKYPVMGQFIYKDIIMFGAQSSPERMEKVSNFEIRDDDICIATYPRTGTRFISEITSWVLHEGDEEKFQMKMTFDRWPYLEFSAGPIKKDPDYFDALPPTSRRCFVTHLSTMFAPKQLGCDDKGKIICVFRNPKDTAVSYYNFYRMNNYLGPYTGSWDEFLQAFCDGNVAEGSYFDFVKTWWHRKDQKNVLLLRYEEMKKNSSDAIKQVADFLGVSLSEEVIKMAVQKTSLEHMKSNPMVNLSRIPDQQIILPNLGLEFVNKGLVGEWKKYFTVAQNEAFEKLIEEKLGDTGLVFQYSI